jgi:phosphatidylserine decarboxylase
VTRIRYVERSSGELRDEQIIWDRFLPWLYTPTLGARACRAVLRSRPPSVVYGWLQRAPWSKRRISGLVTRLAIDAEESEKPASDYGSLAAFFSRRLRPGARPFAADPDVLPSPADGRVLAFPRLAGGTIPVKGRGFSLAALVGDEQLARTYEDGAGVVIRLAPGDYHWFHFPDSGAAGRWRVIPGAYDSVSHYALERAPEILCLNYRHVTVLESRGFGPVLVVAIGALFAGSIIQVYRPGPVERGQPQGYFGLGASSMVLATLPGRLQLDADLIANTRQGLETRVRMGTSLGRRPTGAAEQ